MGRRRKFVRRCSICFCSDRPVTIKYVSLLLPVFLLPQRNQFSKLLWHKVTASIRKFCYFVCSSANVFQIYKLRKSSQRKWCRWAFESVERDEKYSVYISFQSKNMFRFFFTLHTCVIDWQLSYLYAYTLKINYVCFVFAPSENSIVAEKLDRIHTQKRWC